VQESLTNVGKYAQARNVDVSLRNYSNHIELEIRDDGSGFDATRVKPSTHGLAGMRHRVEAAGGRLSVMSRPGAGTRIGAVLPKPARPAERDEENAALEPADASKVPTHA
jgi:signal transduction histidine kinase